MKKDVKKSLNLQESAFVRTSICQDRNVITLVMEPLLCRLWVPSAELKDPDVDHLEYKFWQLQIVQAFRAEHLETEKLQVEECQ